MSMHPLTHTLLSLPRVVGSAAESSLLFNMDTQLTWTNTEAVSKIEGNHHARAIGSQTGFPWRDLTYRCWQFDADVLGVACFVFLKQTKQQDFYHPQWYHLTDGMALTVGGAHGTVFKLGHPVLSQGTELKVNTLWCMAWIRTANLPHAWLQSATVQIKEATQTLCNSTQTTAQSWIRILITLNPGLILTYWQDPQFSMWYTLQYFGDSVKASHTPVYF